MLLHRVRLKNYRAFVREAAISLRPLTLLFGYNSAGKSALLRALPLIAESIRWKTGPLALNGRATPGSTFRDVRTRWSAGDRLSFGLDWSDRDASLDVEIAHLASTQREIIEMFRLRDGELGELCFEVDLADERATDITTYALDDEHGRIRFDGWCPADVEGFAGVGVHQRLTELNVKLKRVAHSVHWLGALRAQPERYLPLVRSSITENGAGTIEVLARESLSVGSNVVQTVSEWFQQATRHELRVREQPVGGTPHFHVELRPLNAPLGIHLADTGEGMTQVLPVITLGALAMNGRLGDSPILAIEDPELHLHPRAHEEVAAYLVEVAKYATVVVETHSENILLKVQLAIATGKLQPEDVIIHWVRATDEGPSFVETITFDEKARPSAWPPGVFAEDRDLARRLIEERHGLGLS